MVILEDAMADVADHGRRLRARWEGANASAGEKSGATDRIDAKNTVVGNDERLIFTLAFVVPRPDRA